MAPRPGLSQLSRRDCGPLAQLARLLMNLPGDVPAVLATGGAVICGALIRSGLLAQPGTPSPERGAAQAEAGPGVPA